MFIETDCTVSHEGRTFTARGAYVTESSAIVYVGKPWDSPISAQRWQGPVTDWHGKVIGAYREVSRWRVPNGWVSGWVHAYRVNITDESGAATYWYGRGSGEGMMLRLRRFKG
jgi:hypothetical protein